MGQSNAELLRRFDQMRRWMVEDTQRAMFDARANFLVAQGLFNYTEVIGSFIVPHGNSGQRFGNSGQRFDSFFERMGPEYGALLRRFNNKRRRNRHIVYDDLRCGLTHEYTVKRKLFTIFGADGRLSEAEINSGTITVDGTVVPVTAGVLHRWIRRGLGIWCVITPKYWLDFQNALEAYWNQINDPQNAVLRANFFRRAREVNFLRFRVGPSP
jgi:hypothetical protein